MKSPLISWHTVTFDRPTLLQELLYFFMSQTYENKELVIINDQNNIKYSCDIPNVHIFNIEKRFISLGSKRNFAMSKCSGEYVLIADDDDLYYSKHTEHLVDYHIKHPEFDIIKDKCVEFSIDNNIKEHKAQHMGFPQSCIKREFIEKNKFNNDLNYREDQEYLKNAKIGLIENNEIYFQYRWGLNTYHLSGLANNDPYDLNYQRGVWDNILNDHVNNKCFYEIELKPQLFGYNVKNYK
jgi:glycosyltransferase involved in cell wall biosynthesis